MSTTRSAVTTPLPAGLLSGLVDDAALFPPGNAPMAEAVPSHLRFREQSFAELVGPFLCPGSRLDELATAADALTPGTDLDIGLVVDTGTGAVAEGVDRVRSDPRLSLRGVELPLRGDDLAITARRACVSLRDAEVDDLAFVEVPRGPGWERALDVLAESGELRAKLRTGGVTAEAFPSEDEVAAFITACLDRELPFKLTAGLHQAVRHTGSPSDPALGFEHHGFLNALVATGVALDGGTTVDAAQVLALRDAAQLVAMVEPDRIRSARRWFTSFGTCSIEEPIDDLVALGLLAGPVPA